MSTTKDTYTVPREIALATSTGRIEFIEGLIKRTTAENPLPVPQQIELLRMLKDMIGDRHSQQRHLNDKALPYVEDDE